MDRRKWLGDRIRGVERNPRIHPPGSLDYLKAELAKLERPPRRVAVERVPRRVNPEDRIARLEARIARLEGYLAGGYSRGEYVERLGERPTAPCVVVEDRVFRRFVKRAVVAYYMGPKPDGAFVHRACDDPKCVARAHLFWATPSDIARDCVLRGRGGMPAPTRDAWEARLARLKARLARLRD